MSRKKSIRAELTSQATELLHQIQKLPEDQRGLLVGQLQVELLSAMSATTEDLQRLAPSSEKLTAAGGTLPNMSGQLVAALDGRREADRALSEFLESVGSSGVLTKEQTQKWKALLRSVRDAERNVKTLLTYSETAFRLESR